MTRGREIFCTKKKFERRGGGSGTPKWVFASVRWECLIGFTKK